MGRFFFGRTSGVAMKSTPDRERLSREQLIRENDQAWAHYRHLSEMQMKYHDRFFVVLLGTIGFLIGIFEKLSKTADVPGRLLLVSLLLFVVFVVLASIIRSINREGHVARTYAAFMQNASQTLFQADPSTPTVWQIHLYMKDGFNIAGLTSKDAELYTMVFIAALFAPAQALVQSKIGFHPWMSPVLYAPSILGLATLLGAGALAGAIREGRRHHDRVLPKYDWPPGAALHRTKAVRRKCELFRRLKGSR